MKKLPERRWGEGTGRAKVTGMHRIAVGFILLTSSISAQTTLLQYSFTSQSLSPTSSPVANVTGGDFSSNDSGSTSNSSPVSQGYTGASGSYYFSDNNWTGTSPGTNYFSFTITPESGYSVSISAVTFGYKQSSTSGATSFSIYSSKDGYAASLASGILDTIYATTGGTQGNNWGLASASVTLTFTSATTIRIYANGASSGTPTLRGDDFIISGSVSASPVPEPATYALFGGLTVLGLASVRRIRSRSA